jgi:hypothetical protein
MTYERFLKVTLGVKRESERLDKLYKLGVELYDIVDPYHVIINELIKEVYGDDGFEWWSWFCWESDFGQKDWSVRPTYKTNEDGAHEIISEVEEVKYGAHDAEGNPICYSFESTWEYLEKNCKTYLVKKHKK